MVKEIAPQLDPYIKSKLDLEAQMHPLINTNINLETEKKNINWIYEKIKEINSIQDPVRMLQLTDTILKGVSGISNFALYIIDETTHDYKKELEFNLNPVMKKYLIYFIKEKQKDFFHSLTSNIKYEILDLKMKEQYSGLNIYPVAIKNEIMGILIQFDGQENKISENTVNYIKIVTRYIAMGIKKSSLYATVQQLSRKDGLTSLNLRRVFDELIKKEVSRVKRYKNNLSVIMMDIDYFKKLNDQYGHIFGDKVLSRVAGIILENIQTPFSAARYGGEEFVIICPDTGLEEAYLLADKIRDEVREFSFKYEDEIVHTSISGGVAKFSKKLNTSELLIKAADDKLYEAKEGGRNQIVK
jgi:diguanylate cyclase (GGDEF)-like protein